MSFCAILTLSSVLGGLFREYGLSWGSPYLYYYQQLLLLYKLNHHKTRYLQFVLQQFLAINIFWNQCVDG